MTRYHSLGQVVEVQNLSVIGWTDHINTPLRCSTLLLIFPHHMVHYSTEYKLRNALSTRRIHQLLCIMFLVQSHHPEQAGRLTEDPT